MIHVGFLVQNRDVETISTRLAWLSSLLARRNEARRNRLGRDASSGRHDWLEYMLNHPEHPDLRLMGVLNHISLGVADIRRRRPFWKRTAGSRTGAKRLRWEKTASGS